MPLFLSVVTANFNPKNHYYDILIKAKQNIENKKENWI